VGGRKSPSPITLAIGLYNSLYYRTSRDVESTITFLLLSSTLRDGAFCDIFKHLSYSDRWICFAATARRLVFATWTSLVVVVVVVVIVVVVVVVVVVAKVMK